ncbi:DUF1631 family protein [Marinobacter zhejiangensis]|uniref:DUF1631 domain-containing protein n=1 Tax=Marinobacter zhejiangensis TaxID=488535 RepID=A0A1I4RU82_9GAMM|nr:DUF1631 family protein [Marinobacter zhejiangensis]SFM55795.1 Protein of unknown function [Marinobacter zhejiangensis]
MSLTTHENPVRLDTAALEKKTDAIIQGIRIPDLPYPIKAVDPGQEPDWRPLLLSCWSEQRNETVSHVLRSVSVCWTVRQVNAAYISDRVMDVLLKTSGLHLALVQKVARLRFFLAWRLSEEGGSAFDGHLCEWLDSLGEWRGWSDTGGRSSRVLLDQLEGMVIAVSASFETQSLEPFHRFCDQWKSDALARHERTAKLQVRLLESETGMARQRQAEQVARAAIGRALTNRELPPVISGFIRNHWLPLMRQAVLASGTESADWRHANKLLQWLTWIGDPSLSHGSSERLYKVGEQIGDSLSSVWERVQGGSLPSGAMTAIEGVIVARLRGEELELAPALDGGLETFDESWLSTQNPSSADLAAVSKQWFVEGVGAHEQRRFFTAFLDASSEVLWTNGAGTKLGITPWHTFVQARNSGALRLLPQINGFEDLLCDTVQSLDTLYHQQRQQRRAAAERAREQADALRKKVEAAEDAKRNELEMQRLEIEREHAERERRQQEQRDAEALRLRREMESQARERVDGLKLGSWIAVNDSDTDSSPTRLKLAVKIAATKKLVFVDRLGLNRTEYTEQGLIDDLVEGRVRVLSDAAEFDDALSRVVGRIRMGKH